MMCFARKVKILSFIFLFLLFISILIIKPNTAIAQNYFPFSSNPIYGNLFGSQIMPTYNPIFNSSYQFGQPLNTFGSNFNQNFGVIPIGYYSGSTQTKEMVKGELIIYLSNQVQIEQHANGPRTNVPELNDLLDQYGVYDIDVSSSGGFYVLKFSESHNVNDVRQSFEGLSNYVESAEPNYIRKAHTTSSGFNTMMGGWFPQISSAPGLNVSYSGTGLSFGSQLPAFQSSNLGFPFSQFTYAPGLSFGSAWQNQGLSFFQPLFNTWQQTSRGIPQSFNPAFINSFPGNWF